MGFLSRKSKFMSTPVEEPHPIVEELEQMEEAVPEAPVDDKPSRAHAGGSCRCRGPTAPCGR